jgi:ubiquinone/menaquinone biosynthesis C-methylase UbiE
MTSETIYDIAEAIAPTWERRRTDIEAFVGPVRDWMLRELAARDGDIVLELAAGVGDTGFDAAALIGERGRLISSDFSPAMVAAARRRGAERGLRNVEYRVIDAARIELDDACVDGVLCRFGYMLLDDAAAAFAETLRVLRPSGRLALAVWGAPERNPWIAIVANSLVERGHVPSPESTSAAAPFSLSSATRTSELLRSAGFGQVRAEVVPVQLTVPDADEYIDFIADTAGPTALALRGLSQTERSGVRADVARSLARFSSGDGYELPGVAVCAAASGNA